MSDFLNLMFFFGVFGLIMLFARLSENRASRTVYSTDEKRAA